MISLILSTCALVMCFVTACINYQTAVLLENRILKITARVMQIVSGLGTVFVVWLIWLVWSMP